MYNASCYCKGNVGSSEGVGQAIIKDTDWYRQFDGGNDNLFTSGYVTKTVGNFSLTIYARPIQVFWQYYYPMEWSNILIHNFSMNMFELYDPNNYILSPLREALLTCAVTYSSPHYAYEGFNTSDQCVARIQQLLGITINPVINLGYNINPTYQTACNIDYCQLSYCPQSNLITIGFFCATVIGTCYTVIRTLKHLFIWMWYRKYKLPAHMTTPMITPA